MQLRNSLLVYQFIYLFIITGQAAPLMGSGKTRNGEIENGKPEMEKWVEMKFLRC